MTGKMDPEEMRQFTGAANKDGNERQLQHTISCPVCGSSNYKVLQSNRLLCNDCGKVFVPK